MTAIFSLFNAKQMKPEWNFNAGALIWRIFFTSANRIIGETRDHDSKSTSFFCVDASSGKPLWNDIGFDEPWWIGVEAVHDRWMILHGFVRPDMPEHRGVRVIEIESGKLLWRNEDLSFWFAENEKLYAHKYLFDTRIGYEIDIKTGTILNEYDGDIDVLQEVRRKASQQEIDNQRDVMFPEVFDDGETDSAIKAIIQQITDGKAIEGWIEYIIFQDILIVSQYRHQQGQAESSLLNNLLSVYDMVNHKILFQDIIVQDVKVPSPDTFFVKNKLLYFIKHQTILTALRPWKL
jgi:hypothetical protein